MTEDCNVERGARPHAEEHQQGNDEIINCSLLAQGVYNTRLKERSKRKEETFLCGSYDSHRVHYL